MGHADFGLELEYQRFQMLDLVQEQLHRLPRHSNQIAAILSGRGCASGQRSSLSRLVYAKLGVTSLDARMAWQLSVAADLALTTRMTRRLHARLALLSQQRVNLGKAVIFGVDRLPLALLLLAVHVNSVWSVVVSTGESLRVVVEAVGEAGWRSHLDPIEHKPTCKIGWRDNGHGGRVRPVGRDWTLCNRSVRRNDSRRNCGTGRWISMSRNINWYRRPSGLDETVSIGGGNTLQRQTPALFRATLPLAPRPAARRGETLIRAERPRTWGHRAAEASPPRAGGLFDGRSLDWRSDGSRSSARNLPKPRLGPFGMCALPAIEIGGRIVERLHARKAS
jgi:hypothetical protein